MKLLLLGAVSILLAPAMAETRPAIKSRALTEALMRHESKANDQRWHQLFGRYQLDRELYEPLFRDLLLRAPMGVRANARLQQQWQTVWEKGLLKEWSRHCVVPSSNLWILIADYFLGEGSLCDFVLFN